MRTAAAVIIGDELLTAKVRDVNGALLIDRLREAGIALGRLAIVGDELDDIASEVAAVSSRYDFVITSGGVGPTHDDRTFEGVARAFGIPLVSHPEIQARIRERYGARTNAAALKMALVPEGTEIWRPAGASPILVCRNVYILPGIPNLFLAKLGPICERFRSTGPALGKLYLKCDESDIAAQLDAVLLESPTIKIGSYPLATSDGRDVLLTLEALTAAAVNVAIDQLLARLPSDLMVRVERPAAGT